MDYHSGCILIKYPGENVTVLNWGEIAGKNEILESYGWTAFPIPNLAKEIDSWNNMLTFLSIVYAFGSWNHFHACCSYLEHKFCHIPRK